MNPAVKEFTFFPDGQCDEKAIFEYDITWSHEN